MTVILQMTIDRYRRRIYFPDVPRLRRRRKRVIAVSTPRQCRRRMTGTAQPAIARRRTRLYRSAPPTARRPLYDGSAGIRRLRRQIVPTARSGDAVKASCAGCPRHSPIAGKITVVSPKRLSVVSLVKGASTLFDAAMLLSPSWIRARTGGA